MTKGGKGEQSRNYYKAIKKKQKASCTRRLGEEYKGGEVIQSRGLSRPLRTEKGG